jgi:hypothetical protein
MYVARVLLLAAGVAVGLTAPLTAQAQQAGQNAAPAAQARAPQKPWRQVLGIGRVLDLTNPPIVIDEPGLYAIQKNWQIPAAATQANAELIRITANDVTLDLHGFKITAAISAPPASTLLAITGFDVEIRNGGVEACCTGGVAFHSTTPVRLHHLDIYSHETMTFEGLGTSISDSQINARVGIELAGNSSLERNTILCNFTCATLNGDGSRVTDNHMSPFNFGGIAVVGNGNLVANNVMDASSVLELREGFTVDGNNNVLRNNTVLVGSNVGKLWSIDGSGNTLDGNVAAPAEPGARGAVGIEFLADGNYYGDNRMAAAVPFALGATTQTDWGGNVGY